MPWKPEKLAALAARSSKAREKLEPLEAAALAYARWQGLTAEDGIDYAAQKTLLDRHLDRLDAMDPTIWLGLRDLSEDVGETVLVGLMRYSLARSGLQMRDRAAEITETHSPGPSPSRRRPKDRTR